MKMQIADNLAHSTYGYNGGSVSEWPDGKQHPDPLNNKTCIINPNRECTFTFANVAVTPEVLARLVHTQNESMAAGTSFAIAHKVCFHILLLPVFDDGHVYIAVKYQRRNAQ